MEPSYTGIFAGGKDAAAAPEGGIFIPRNGGYEGCMGAAHVFFDHGAGGGDTRMQTIVQQAVDFSALAGQQQDIRRFKRLLKIVTQASASIVAGATPDETFGKVRTQIVSDKEYWGMVKKI